MHILDKFENFQGILYELLAKMCFYNSGYNGKYEHAGQIFLTSVEGTYMHHYIFLQLTAMKEETTDPFFLVLLSSWCSSTQLLYGECSGCNRFHE